MQASFRSLSWESGSVQPLYPFLGYFLLSMCILVVFLGKVTGSFSAPTGRNLRRVLSLESKVLSVEAFGFWKGQSLRSLCLAGEFGRSWFLDGGCLIQDQWPLVRINVTHGSAVGVILRHLRLLLFEIRDGMGCRLRPPEL